METKNGTKNPLLKLLKNGDVVMIEIPFHNRTIKEIVRLKNLNYQPVDEEFSFDWLDFECDILYTNVRMHPSMVKSCGNCLSISEIIPEALIENMAIQNDMWRRELHQLSDAEYEAMKNRI